VGQFEKAPARKEATTHENTGPNNYDRWIYRAPQKKATETKKRNHARRARRRHDTTCLLVGRSSPLHLDLGEHLGRHQQRAQSRGRRLHTHRRAAEHFAESSFALGRAEARTRRHGDDGGIQNKTANRREEAENGGHCREDDGRDLPRPLEALDARGQLVQLGPGDRRVAGNMYLPRADALARSRTRSLTRSLTHARTHDAQHHINST
jgi:hypothetical protein